MSWIIWIIAAVILVILEIVTTSLFFFSCLAVGAVFAGIASAFGAGIWIQVAIFSVVSIVSVSFIRPLLKKYMKTADSKKSNIDEIIGKEAVVTENISEKSQGFVKVMGEIWSAFSESGEIEKGSAVEVVSVQGTRLIVRKK
ncbi:MAG: NfeD family protein [Endomicrobium sp.]|jgi:membrane protein implicated in regulation of membrane protease activity|nr:NfeD family protein [Endomicrobium sp.]